MKMLTADQFTTLYESLNQKAINFITRKSRSVVESEDVVSRAWLCLWRVHEKVEFSPEGLFWKILKLQYRDYVRDDKSRKRIFDPEYTILLNSDQTLSESAEDWFMAIEAVRNYDPVKHGTASGYNTQRCRCEPCRVAWKAQCKVYSARYRNKNRSAYNERQRMRCSKQRADRLAAVTQLAE